MDDDTGLLITLVGIPTRSFRSQATEGPHYGGPIHRVLRRRDGSVLFSYDLQLSGNRQAGFLYRFMPAKQQPTLSAVREANVRGGEIVSLDILENPQTGARISDTLILGGRVLGPAGRRRLLVELRQLFVGQ